MNNERQTKSLDEILAKIEEQHQQKRQFPGGTELEKASTPTKPPESKSSNSIDNSLEEIQAKMQTQKQSSFADATKKKQCQHTTTDEFLAQIKTKFAHQKSQSQPKSQTNTTQDSLQTLAHQYQASKQQQIQQKQQEKIEDIQKQELNKQRQRKQLTRQAKEWLKNLDPNSDEGFWFEQFALAYESKLEAAIDYLDALN